MRDMLFTIFTFYRLIWTESGDVFRYSLNYRNSFYILFLPIAPLAILLAIAIMKPLNAIIMTLIVVGIIATAVNATVLYVVQSRAKSIIREEEERRYNDERIARERQEELERKQRRAERQRAKDTLDEAYRRAIRDAWREHAQREAEARYRRYEHMKDGANQFYRSEYSKPDQNMINAYKLMDLKKDSTKTDVRSRYRELCKVHHPDLGGTHENFIRLNKAYKYIIDNM